MEVSKPRVSRMVVRIALLGVVQRVRLASIGEGYEDKGDILAIASQIAATMNQKGLVHTSWCLLI